MTMFLLSTDKRRRQPEIMDQDDLAPERLCGALRGLERINWWSGSARILWPSIRRIARQNPTRPLRLLDIATGAGDVPLQLWRKAQRAGISLEVQGCDRNADAVAFARRRAKEQSAQLSFFTCDALHKPFPNVYDIVTCSLFLHHLGDEQAVELLRKMAAMAQSLVLVNDLVRSRAGLAMAYLGTRLLSASTVVHTDGPRSVEGAFTVEEIQGLADAAGLAGARVIRRWPCRWLLEYTRHG
jgi:2-polyprenyl-3-methyl-5-hydroxy-6-metoxy-1,4-benzoquinol methylase